MGRGSTLRTPKQKKTPKKGHRTPRSKNTPKGPKISPKKAAVNSDKTQTSPGKGSANAAAAPVSAPSSQATGSRNNSDGIANALQAGHSQPMHSGETAAEAVKRRSREKRERENADRLKALAAAAEENAARAREVQKAQRSD